MSHATLAVILLLVSLVVGMAGWMVRGLTIAMQDMRLQHGMQIHNLRLRVLALEFEHEPYRAHMTGRTIPLPDHPGRYMRYDHDPLP